MLKINLLPEHFALVRRTKQLIALFAVLIVIVVVVWVGYSFKLGAARAAEQARIDEFQPKAAAVDQLETETGSIKQQIPTFARRVLVVRQLERLPERYIEEFDKVKRYIFANAQVLSCSISGSEIRISAEADTAMDVGRFYLNINRCPYITNIGFTAWGGGGRGGGGFGGGGGDDDDDEDEDEDGGPSPGVFGGFGGGGGGGGAAIAGGKIPIQVSARLVSPIGLPTPGAGAAPTGPARPAPPPTSVAPAPGAGVPGATPRPPAGGVGADMAEDDDLL